MPRLNNIDFMFELAFNKRLPAFYSGVLKKIDGESLLVSTNLEEINTKNELYLVTDVPSYLKINTKLNSSIAYKSVTQYKGYCIDLTNVANIETYIQSQFGKSSRQLLRSAKKRLELCFNITYKVYYGSNLDKNHFDDLFNCFYDMLKRRSREKGIDNRNLKQWDLYKTKVHEMILHNQASLFVIYDETKPISFTLNLHIKDVVFLFITSYDIDYSKFRLGHTNWIVLIEWLLKNNIKLVDFSKGNVGYKKRWANLEYEFKYHLFYKNTDFKLRIKANWTAKKLQVLQYLRNKNINHYYYRTLDKFLGKRKKFKSQNYQLVHQKSLPDSNDIKRIDFRENEDYSMLRRIVYSYLYKAFLHVDTLHVYKDVSFENVYYFQTKEEVIKLTVKN